MKPEDVDVGEAGAKAFQKYWDSFVKTNPEYKNDVYCMAIYGIIFFNGFSDGYDYYKEKVRELSELN